MTFSRSPLQDHPFVLGSLLNCCVAAIQAYNNLSFQSLCTILYTEHGFIMLKGLIQSHMLWSEIVISLQCFYCVSLQTAFRSRKLNARKLEHTPVVRLGVLSPASEHLKALKFARSKHALT